MDFMTLVADKSENKSGVYSYEQRPEQLIEPYLGLLKKNRAAWTFFQAQARWYQQAAEGGSLMLTLDRSQLSLAMTEPGVPGKKQSRPPKRPGGR